VQRNHPVTVFESTPFDNGVLSHQAIQELQGLETQTFFVKDNTEHIDDKDKYVFSSFGSKKTVCWRYVGVIRTSDGSVIEILPKIYRNHDEKKDSARKLLCRMLKRSGLLTYRTAKSASLAAGGHTLLEIFVHAFLSEVQRLSVHGLQNDYIKHEENRCNKKGRINFTQQVRANAAAAHKLYCTYDDYCPNCIENALLCSALWKITRITASLANKRLAKQLLVFFDGVSTIPNVENRHFDQCRTGRLMKRYELALSFARFILLIPPTLQCGAQNSVAILFDMATVFEKTVEKTLQQSEQLTNFKAQKSITWFSGLASPRPDYQFETTEKIVADAKWKFLESNKLSKNDQYQIFSYMQATRSKQGAILYPSISEHPTERSFNSKIEGCNGTISLVPFFLEKLSVNFSVMNMKNSDF
jgi:5-methylcytosine-specific restriction enzyme subunit McrC